MQNYINVLVEELKKGGKPLDVLAAFIAAWSTVDSSNILSTQIRRRLGLTYMGNIQQAISSLVSRISSDPNFKQKAIDILALAIERDWVRNALKDAAYKGVASQLKQAAEELYNYKRSYSTKIFLEDISKILESQQVRSFFDYQQYPQQQYPGYPNQQFYPGQYPKQQYPPQQQAYPQQQVAQPTVSPQQPSYPVSPKPPEYSAPSKPLPPKPPSTPSDTHAPPVPERQFPAPPGTIPSGPAKPTSIQQKPQVMAIESQRPKPATTEVIAQVRSGVLENLKLLREDLVKQLDTIQVRFNQMTSEIKTLKDDLTVVTGVRKEINDQLKSVIARINTLQKGLNELSEKYDEIRNAIKNIEDRVSSELSQIRGDISNILQQIVSLKEIAQTSVQSAPKHLESPSISEVPEIIEDVKKSVSEIFDMLEESTEKKPSLPTDLEKMIEEEMKKHFQKVKETGVSSVPPYLFILAIGNISKLQTMLTGSEIPGFLGRWSITITVGGKKSTIYIQALHREISNETLNEALNLANGFLILAPIKNVVALNNALVRLVERAKKSKFVIIDSDRKLKGLVVPPELKEFFHTIKSKDDLTKIIKEEILPLFE